MFTLNQFFEKKVEASYFTNNKSSKEDHSVEKIEKLIANLQTTMLEERGFEDPIDLQSLAKNTIFESEKAIDAFEELSKSVKLIKEAIYDGD